MTRLSLPQLIAHRGAPRVAPENTLAALEAAYQRGATWVECDVQLTADGIPVIFHDDTLQRTTNGRGRLCTFRYEELATLDAGRWFSAAFAGEPIPRLEDWLALALRHQMGVNLELKLDARDSRVQPLVEAVMQVLTKQWPLSAPPPLLSSFSAEVVLALAVSAKASAAAPEASAETSVVVGSRETSAKASSPEEAAVLASAAPLSTTFPVQRAWIVNTWDRAWPGALNALSIDNLHIHHRQLTRRRVRALCDAGYRVLAYTVNRRARAERLFEWGVSAVFTDDPLLLHNVSSV